MANGEVNTINARYNLGYALLKMENYPAAKEQFETIAKNVSSASSTIEKMPTCVRPIVIS